MSGFILTLTEDEKAYLLRSLGKFIQLMELQTPAEGSAEGRILSMEKDFVRDYTISQALAIPVSRVFLKAVRMQLNISSAAHQRTADRYAKLSADREPFDPNTVGRRKEDYLANNAERTRLCNNILTKIQELVS